MPYYFRNRGLRGCLMGLALVMFLSGCAYLSPQTGKVPQPSEGTLAAYINFYSPTNEEISFKIHSIQLIQSDGKAITLPVDLSLTIQSDARQIFIEKNIPAAHYQKIGFLFTEGVLNYSGTPVTLKHSTEYTFLDAPFFVPPEMSTDISINCEVGSQKNDALNQEELFFQPKLSRKKKSVALKSLMLYVTNTGDDNVYVIDRLNNSVVSVIQVGKQPKGLVVNPEGTYVYVANSGSNTVSVIDSLTNDIEETIDLPLGLGPSALTISPDGKYLFSANSDSDNVSLIDTDLERAIDLFEVGRQPVDLKVSPSGLFLYVTNKGSDDLYIFNLENRLTGREPPLLTAKIPLRSNPWGMVVVKENPSQYSSQPMDDHLFIANSGSSSIFSLVINVDQLRNVTDNELNTEMNDIIKESSILQAEYGPTQIVSDEDARHLYITNQKEHSVSSFSPSRNIQENRYQVGRMPMGLALDTERNYLYVVNSGEDSLSIIDLRQERVIDSIRVGKEPFGVDLIRR